MLLFWIDKLFRRQLPIGPNRLSEDEALRHAANELSRLWTLQQRPVANWINNNVVLLIPEGSDYELPFMVRARNGKLTLLVDPAHKGMTVQLELNRSDLLSENTKHQLEMLFRGCRVERRGAA